MVVMISSSIRWQTTELLQKPTFDFSQTFCSFLNKGLDYFIDILNNENHYYLD